MAGRRPSSKISREAILLTAGLIIAAVELIHAEILGGVFHYEFLILAAALCGVSITQWGDRQ